MGQNFPPLPVTSNEREFTVCWRLIHRRVSGIVGGGILSRRRPAATGVTNCVRLDLLMAGTRVLHLPIEGPMAALGVAAGPRTGWRLQIAGAYLLGRSSFLLALHAGLIAAPNSPEADSKSYDSLSAANR